MIRRLLFAVEQIACSASTKHRMAASNRSCSSSGNGRVRFFVALALILESSSPGLWKLSAQTGGTPSPPVITADPQDQVFAPGSTVVLSVSASGDGPLSYQWYKNGLITVIDNAQTGGSTTPTLTLRNVTVGGSYAAEVSNSAGSILSGYASVLPGDTTPGDHWQERDSPVNTALCGVTYGGGSFVAVGSNGVVITSSNGTRWTSQTTRRMTSFRGVAYGNGAFVVVGVGGTIITSIDAISWASEFSGTTESLFACIYSNGSFVAVGDNETIITSPAGSILTRQSLGGPNPLLGVAYGNGTFVAVGLAGTILTSTDAATWVPVDSGTTTDLNGIAYGAGTFVAIGDAGAILTSPDGATWTTQSSGKTNSLTGIAYGYGVFVAVGGGRTLLVSSDGVIWASRSTGFAKGDVLSAVAYGGGTFVAIDQSGAILQSYPVLLRLLLSRTGSANRGLLTWPADVGNYVLESADPKVVPLTWAQASESATLAGGLMSAEVDTSAGSKWYRLRRP
jgi:hypothetical protein